MHLCEEKPGSVEFNTVWDANVAHESAGPCGPNCLHHGFLRTNALQHGINAQSFREVLDSCDTFVTAFAHDLGGAKLARQFLPRWVAAHRDDSLRAHLPGRKNSKQADRAVTHNQGRL